MTSRVWYVVAMLLFVGAGAGAAWALWSGIAGAGDSIVRIEVPGSGELTLDTPGTYTIYHEQEDVTDGHISVVQSLDGMTVTVTDESTGTKLYVNTPNMSSSYTVGGHKGVSVLAFNVTHPGRYRLAAANNNGRSGLKTTLAVDLGLFGRIFRTIGLTFGIGGLGALLALILVLVTFFRRRRMLRPAMASRVP